ncbi:hypothetical protein TNCV_3497111 [Trichonephila clavipes]|nr:hypothetical protein TNCV_3497111 [Trichonephila clavipes]
MPLCRSVHDLELAVKDLWAHLPQLDVVRRAIEVAQYLCRCTPCIRSIVLFLRSRESFICVIKFHFNPMLSSWVAIFNVPECIPRMCMTHAKSVKVLSLPVSVVWKFRRGGLHVWLTSSSLGHSSEFRGPSPTDFVLILFLRKLSRNN